MRHFYWLAIILLLTANGCRSKNSAMPLNTPPRLQEILSQGEPETLVTYENDEIQVVALRSHGGLSTPIVILSEEDYFLPYLLGGEEPPPRIHLLKVTEGEVYLLFLMEFDIGIYRTVLSVCNLRKNQSEKWELTSRILHYMFLKRDQTAVFETTENKSECSIIVQPINSNDTFRKTRVGSLALLNMGDKISTLQLHLPTNFSTLNLQN